MKGRAKQRKMAANFYHLSGWRITSVPFIANVAAPTVAELSAGVVISSGYERRQRYGNTTRRTA